MGHAFFSALGVTSAVMLVGGYLALRWRRDREQFVLLQTALEQGLTEFPNTPPYWLVSIRQAALILTLGLLLVAIGSVLQRSAGQVPMPDVDELGAISALEPAEPPPPPPDDRPPGGHRGPPHHPRPPRPYPALERWHRAQTQDSLGLLCVAAGTILAGLGAVRGAFAMVERRYAFNTIAGPRHEQMSPRD